MAFNENDKPKELEDFVKILGLQAEGENFEGPTLKAEPEIQSLTPKIFLTPSDNLLKQTEVPELPRLQFLLTTEGWTTPNTDYHNCITHPNHLYLLTFCYISLYSTTTTPPTPPTPPTSTPTYTFHFDLHFLSSNLSHGFLSCPYCITITYPHTS